MSLSLIVLTFLVNIFKETKKRQNLRRLKTQFKCKESYPEFKKAVFAGRIVDHLDIVDVRIAHAHLVVLRMEQVVDISILQKQNNLKVSSFRVSAESGETNPRLFQTKFLKIPDLIFSEYTNLAHF